MRPYLKKPFAKIGLAEWLKVKAPVQQKKKKKKTALKAHPSDPLPLLGGHT
jgi:hypothetical protein